MRLVGSSRRTSVAFFLALGVVCVSAFFLLREGITYDPLVGLIGGIGVLLCDFLWKEDAGPEWYTLRSRKKDRLRKLLKNGGSRTIGKCPRRTFVQRFNETYRTTPTGRNVVTKPMVRVPCCRHLDFLVFLVFEKYSPVPSRSVPDLELAWYLKRGAKVEIVPFETFRQTIRGNDVIDKGLRIPIQLAVSNPREERLDNVRVHIRYPSAVEVSSEGSPKYDQSGKTHMYEHKIGTLEQIKDYTLLRTVDVVYIRQLFEGTRSITLSETGVPEYRLEISPERTCPTFHSRLRPTLPTASR